MSVPSPIEQPRPLKSILDPACRPLPPELVSKPSRLKEAFLPPQPPGSLCKKPAAPLGKSYRRPQASSSSAPGPRPVRGPEILPLDPRTTTPASETSTSPVSSQHQPSSSAHQSDRQSVAAPVDSPRSAASTDTAPSFQALLEQLHDPAPAPSRPLGSVSSSGSTSSLRFCPLPSTGRTTSTRSQSISLAAANRPQPRRCAQPHALPSLPISGGGSYAPASDGSALRPAKGAVMPEGDAVCVGEVVPKEVKKMIKRLRTKEQPGKTQPSIGPMDPEMKISHAHPRSNSISIAELRHRPQMPREPLQVRDRVRYRG